MDKATDVIDAALDIDKSAVKDSAGGHYDADLGTFVEGPTAAVSNGAPNGDLLVDEVPDVLGLNTLLSPQRLAAKFKRQPVIALETKPVAPTPSQHSDADPAQNGTTPDPGSPAAEQDAGTAPPLVSEVSAQTIPAPGTTVVEEIEHVEQNASVSDSADAQSSKGSGDDAPPIRDEPVHAAVDDQKDTGPEQATASVQERAAEPTVAQEISSQEQNKSAKVLIDTQEILSAVRSATPSVVREVREAATTDAVLEQREQQLIHLSDEYGKLQQENERLAAHMQLLVGELGTANAREKVYAWAHRMCYGAVHSCRRGSAGALMRMLL